MYPDSEQSPYNGSKYPMMCNVEKSFLNVRYRANSPRINRSVAHVTARIQRVAEMRLPSYNFDIQLQKIRLRSCCSEIHR